MPTSTEATLAAGTWDADPSHSTVAFGVKHMGIATVNGHFAEFEGSLVVPEDDSGLRVQGTVKVASVSTGVADRDKHLRSADFFDVEQYPEMRFESTAIEQNGSEKLQVSGDLTLHGVTRPITLEATVFGSDTDPWGNDRVGLELTGQLSRGDFDMRFNQALGSGNMLVGDKVKLTLSFSAVQRAE